MHVLAVSSIATFTYYSALLVQMPVLAPIVSHWRIDAD